MREVPPVSLLLEATEAATDMLTGISGLDLMPTKDDQQ